MIKKTAFTRILFFLFFDLILIPISVLFAFLVRFEGSIPYEYFEKGIIQNMIILSVAFSLPIFYFFKLYSFSWSFVSSKELTSLLKAITISFFFISFSIFTLKTFEGFPRSTIIISYLFVFIFCGGIRFSKRIYLETFKKKETEKKKTLIIGAGEAGEQIARNILSGKSFYNPIGFVDDSLVKQGVLIHGLKVFGRIDDMPKIIREKKVEEIIIALPSADSFTIKKAVDIGRNSGIKKIKIIPPIEEIMKEGASLKSLREINLEDLLKRDLVYFHSEKVEKFLKNKKILITGGAGSIGSELVRQTAKFSPSLLLVIDQDETGVFNISKELESFEGFEKECIVGDIRDKEKMERVFEFFKPEIVFHAAAYKHVGLMEKEPDEAVKNNIFGTKILAEVAVKNKVENFVFISTDKAVNPSSVMGMTKRVGEIVCGSLNNDYTKFISVRFGNVLGSRGSIVPLFKEQIKKGGPVEVTHPEMKRYFMMIPEAVSLVLQASEMGEGREVFVLDMGEPVKIIDLAKEMIRLSGFEPDREIAIVFTSPSKGEKLFEEILTAEEGTISTKNKKIFKAIQKNNIENKKILLLLDCLKEEKEKGKIKEKLRLFIEKEQI